MKNLKFPRPASNDDSPSFFENTEEKGLLTVRQVANLLNVSEKTIRGWIYKGLIIPEYIGPRLVRFSKEYIRQWISKKRGS